jgi:hypothetical protein
MINSIRNTVLSVLNKNNYGYISPSDFNLYALQAQMELYEEYFSNYNKDINMENSRMSGSDYADISRALREVLESFLVSDFLYPVYSASGNLLNRFYSPSLITTGNEAYMIENLQCYTNQLTLGSNTSVASFQLVDLTATFLSNGINVGDIVVNIVTNQNTTVESVLSNTVINLNDDIFTSPGEDYRVYSASVYSEVEKVHPAKLSLLSTSTLTSPSLMFPAYEMKGNNMIFYPTSIKGYGVVKATYFRYPKPPKWTYVSLSNGEPSFDQSQPDYQDFEMPQEDEFKLAMKILQYCGMSIREIQVTQFAQGQEQHEQPSFSQQI